MKKTVFYSASWVLAFAAFIWIQGCSQSSSPSGPNNHPPVSTATFTPVLTVGTATATSTPTSSTTATQTVTPTATWTRTGTGTPTETPTVTATIDLCSDGIQDGAETDADCGGPDCNKCSAGNHCAADRDCHGVCVGGICVELTSTPTWSPSPTPSPSPTATPTVTSTPTVTPIPKFLVSIVVVGAGSGDVSSTPSGISCGGTCSAYFNWGAIVTLVATPNSASAFGGFGGVDSDSGDVAVVNVTGDRSVTVRFD